MYTELTRGEIAKATAHITHALERETKRQQNVALKSQSKRPTLNQPGTNWQRCSHDSERRTMDPVSAGFKPDYAKCTRYYLLFD